MKNNVILGILVYLFANNAMAIESVKHCFKDPVEFICVKQGNSKVFLEAKYMFNDKEFRLTSRRAWENNWCNDSLSRINTVMRNNNFCIVSEGIDKEDTNLVLGSVYASNDKWSYFK